MSTTEQGHDWPNLISVYLARRCCTRMALAQQVHATFDEIVAAERGTAPLPFGVARRFLLACDRAGIKITPEKAPCSTT